MPHSYWVTTSKFIAENALKLEDVKTVVLRALTEFGWKETKLK